MIQKNSDGTDEIPLLPNDKTKEGGFSRRTNKPDPKTLRNPPTKRRYTGPKKKR